MQKIVVGFDGSEHGRRALERATALAKTGASLTVVSAAPVTVLVRGGSAISPVDAEERDHALTEARSLVSAAGVEATFVEGSGDPADVIVQEAEDTGADLIIVGTRGLNVAKRWLLGSISTKVVQHAPCDVLVVR